MIKKAYIAGVQEVASGVRQSGDCLKRLPTRQSDNLNSSCKE